MNYAENYAVPVEGNLGTFFEKKNDLKEPFYIRWGSIRFDVFWGVNANVKVVLKVYREGNICEQFIVDTDPYDIQWDRHKRVTRDFYIHPFPLKLGRVKGIKFSYIVHVGEQSIASQYDYLFMEGYHFDENRPHHRAITNEFRTTNTHRTYELDADVLQRDVDWYNRDYGSLNLVPKYTKGQAHHPFHPKRYIHDHIDKVIWKKRSDPEGLHTIKVCVDCIDDTDFISHLIHASHNGVLVQCIVDWRKMTLTNSDNYARLKYSGIELLGVFCTPQHHLIEVAPDMHNKFIIFGDEDCILGSFNITFDRWWRNWESGMTFHSRGICRLLDNIFQSVRGGVIQQYGVDPHSHFNLLYTFGRHTTMNGGYYRPHNAIFSAIHRARHSIRMCLFIIGELQGDHQDSVIDALIHAKRRGVDVQIILNGHMSRQGDPAREYTMKDELERALLPAAGRLKYAGVPVALTYGQDEHAVPYCPIHSKYCVVDDTTVIEGSYNWYNTSIFSHDMLVVAANRDLASAYLHEFYQILRLFRAYY